MKTIKNRSHFIIYSLTFLKELILFLCNKWKMIYWQNKIRECFETLKVVIFCKVSFLGLCSQMQIIPIKILNIKKVVPQFLWFFRLKCWFKGQVISRIHLSLHNAYKLMCFDRNINGNRDVKFLIAIIGHCTDQRKLLYK